MNDETPFNFSGALEFLSRACCDARLVQSDLGVLAVLIAHVNKVSGVTFPSVARIVQESSIPRSTVIRAIGRLERFGWMRSEKRHGAPSRYTLTGVTTGTGSERGTGVISNLRRGRTGVTTGTNPVPSVTPELEKSLKATGESTRASKPQHADCPDWLPADAWQQWLDHRKEVGRKFTARAQEIAIARLGRLRGDGHDPVKLIELAIESGWSSFNSRESTKATRDAGRLRRDPRSDDEIADANEAALARLGGAL